MILYIYFGTLSLCMKEKTPPSEWSKFKKQAGFNYIYIIC